MKTITFGIDCDLSCRTQEQFQEEAERILGRPIHAYSKSFGCWEWEEPMTDEQHEQIAKTLLRYYNNGLCRGCACTDIKRFM